MGSRISSPRFVGRVADVELLSNALGRATAGQPGMVLICGEAGIGKTRLLAEFAEIARAAVAIVTQGTSIELAAGALPYSPLVGALGSLAVHLDQPTRQWLGEPGRAPLRRLVPDLSLPSEPPAPTRRTDERLALFESASGLLRRVSADRTLVFAVEDLHWVDRSSLDLLRHLFLTTSGCRILFIVTFRTDQPAAGIERALTEFERDNRVERIDLARLDWAETGCLIEGIVGTSPTVGLLNSLYARSGGNPFFAEELLAAAPDATAFSPGLRQVALSRVKELSGPAQRLVRVVAVAGRPIDDTRLRSICDLPDDELLAYLAEAIRGNVLESEPGSDFYGFRHALVGEVVYEGTLPGERQRLHLAHARLLADGGFLDPTTLAEIAHHLDRGRAHRAAVEAYVAAASAAESVSAFSEAHFLLERALALMPAAAQEPEDGRTLPEIASVREVAARNATLAGDPERAVELMEASLAELDRTAEPERAALVLERLATYLLNARRDGQRYLAALSEAEALVRDLSPSVDSARVLNSWARMLLVANDIDRVEPAAMQALRMARAVGDRAEEGRALGSLGALRYYADADADGGLADIRAALSVSVSADAIADVLDLYVLVAGIFYDLGDFPSLVSWLEEAFGVVERLGGTRPVALVIFSDLAQVCVDTGNWGRAESLVTRALGLAGNGAAANEGHFPAARLAAGRGQSAAAIGHLAVCWPLDAILIPVRDATIRAEILVNERRWLEVRILVGQELAGCPLLSATAYLLEAGLRAEGELAALARLHHAESGLAEARASAKRMIATLDEVASRPGFRPTAWYRYACALGDAEMSRVENRPDHAAWRTVVEVAEAGGMLYRTIYPRFRLAEALLETASVQGPATVRAEAAHELRTAHCFAARLGAQPLLDLIGALAARARIPLQDPVEPRGTPSTTAGAPRTAESELADVGLSPREIEVLAVLAEGRTNRQIAERLFITEKTAAIHVSRILDKLGVSNRVEAAATAYRLGLGADLGGQSPD